jgi:hypothetical protein
VATLQVVIGGILTHLGRGRRGGVLPFWWSRGAIDGRPLTRSVRSTGIVKVLRRLRPSVEAESAMDLPIAGLMDEDACYAQLVA